MAEYPDDRARLCFHAINPQYKNLQVGFFKIIIMQEFGGLWLDLRGSMEGGPLVTS